MKTQLSETTRMARSGLRVLGHLTTEAVTRPHARSRGDLPVSVDAITDEWLTEVLCAEVPGAEVLDHGFGSGSRGTHERRRILLLHNEAGRKAGLPESVFTKSLPSLVTRMLVGFMGHARYEMLFYQQIRPELTIETPRCYFSASDKRTFAAMHVLEDVVHTKGAHFLDERTSVDKTMAMGMVELLASLHATFQGSERFGTDLRWLVDYGVWFDKGVERVRTDHYSGQAVAKARHVIPERLWRRRDEIWPATERALELHRRLPHTVLHSDVHIGNWYRTASGDMGLLDWQVLTHGHFSRDLSYALSTALEPEDRREWEESLIRRYIEVLREQSGSEVSFDDAWSWYRQQLLHALPMWTQTLCHPRLQPNSQRNEMTYELIRRITTAIDDLDAIDEAGR